MKARVIKKDSAKKRKLLKGGGSHHPQMKPIQRSLQFPVLNDHASDAKNEPSMLVLVYMVGQTKIRPQYWMVFG